MAENLKKKPSRGILKNSSSFDIQDNNKAPRKSSKGGAKWDEMNIMATLHPPDKDYGHMKIDEPKTPYHFEGMEDMNTDMIDATELAERIRQGALTQPRAMQRDQSDEEEDDMTVEEKQSKRDFEMKRKKHYDEYYAMKLARKLLEKDEDEEEEEENPTTSASPHNSDDVDPKP